MPGVKLTTRSDTSLSGSEATQIAAMSPGDALPSTKSFAVTVITGGSLTGVTSIVTVLVVVLPLPSLTMTVKVSVPFQSGSGV